MDIPFDKNYPADAVQCDGCGGHGCAHCIGRGWVRGWSSMGRLCEYNRCKKPLRPDHVAIYCSSDCALADA